jgi:hypothetical protein
MHPYIIRAQKHLLHDQQRCPNCGLKSQLHPLATDPTYKVAFQSEEHPDMNCHWRIMVSKLLQKVVFVPASAFLPSQRRIMP